MKKKNAEKIITVKYSTYAVEKRKPETVPTLPAFKAPFGFLAQLTTALHQYRSDQGSNPGKPEFFSRISFRSCIGCVFNCDDLLGIFLPSAAFNRKRRLIVRHGNIPWASVFFFFFQHCSHL